MKEISYREFQKQMCKLKGEDWLVYGRGGEIVGQWTAGTRVARQEEEEGEAMPDKNIALCQTTGEDLLSKSKNNMEKFLKRVPAEIEVGGEYEGVGFPKLENCIKCGSVHVVGYWSGWEDGEEFVDLAVCKRCAVGKSGIKFKQI